MVRECSKNILLNPASTLFVSLEASQIFELFSINARKMQMNDTSLLLFPPRTSFKRLAVAFPECFQAGKTNLEITGHRHKYSN